MWGESGVTWILSGRWWCGGRVNETEEFDGVQHL
jgi:hypothetical protein